MTKLEIQHQQLNREVVESSVNTECPDNFKGRGIVTCAGGEEYFPPAYVMISMLRKHGCDLPVQIWYLGEKELSVPMKKLASELDNVELVDAYKVAEKDPMRKLGGWECKVFSIMNSPFQEVMFIDGDNVPVRNPEFLFYTPRYKKTGSLFWPDYNKLGRARKIWDICGVEYKKESEFESGQMVINKKVCWDALLVCRHLNEYSDFYYEDKRKTKGYIWGDKETFHMAWRMVDREYGMITKKIQKIPYTMVQHCPSNKPLFQHRNLAKFTFTDYVPSIPGFKYEDECFELLDHVRDVWFSGGGEKGKKGNRIFIKDPTLRKTHRDIVTQGHYIFKKLGGHKRNITLTHDMKIGLGKSASENRWALSKEAGGVVMDLYGENGRSYRLKYQYGGTWTGNSVKGPGRIQLKPTRR